MTSPTSRSDSAGAPPSHLEVTRTKTSISARVVIYTEHDDKAEDARLLVLLPVGVGIERLSPETFTTHVVFNNNMEDQGQRNAAALIRILEARHRARMPKLKPSTEEPAREEAGEWVMQPA